jgi:hypothetical protein
MSDEPQVAVEAVRTVDRPYVMVAVFTLIAAVGGLFGSFTTSATLLVAAIGGTMTWLGLSGRMRRRPAPVVLARGSLWWLVPVLVLGLTELFAFLHADRTGYPTMSLILDPVLDHYLPRAVGYFLWLSAFWRLVRR